MKLVQFVLLLVALIRAATGLFKRKHIFLHIYLNWTEAQTYCRNNYVDLLTVNTEEELVSFGTDQNWHTGWIGLSRRPIDKGFTQWSDGSAVGFTNWGYAQPSSKNKYCVYTYDYKWWTYYCNFILTFYCYTWEPQLIVVPEMKTWTEALVHCRTYYTDLISLTSDTDLFVSSNKSLKVKTPRVWTGLRFMDGKWFWVNNETLGRLVSLPSCPVRPFYCGAKTGANILENKNCNEKMNFICYNRTR